MSRQVSDSSDSPDPGESYEEPVKGAKSLVKMAEQALLRHFKLCVDGLNSPLNYCCGGAALIPASADESAREYSPRRPDELEAPQIVLRWDMPDDDCTRKIQFPLRINSKGLTPAGEKDTQTMQDLLKAMMPSTLKRKREGTSEENLQFGKLNKQQFSVDFDPYECGIIDAISQVLLPRYYLDEMCERQEHQGIVARLRALHVQSRAANLASQSPTTDGDNRIGFLVVRLPYPFEGGELKISYEGHKTFFDWSKSGLDAVDWAAFDIQCNYKVSDVTAGHRFSLIYDLYISEHVGGVFSSPPKLEPRHLPLYENAKSLFEQPAFMKDGGMIGIYCTHSYNHTSYDADERLPDCLRGVDAAIFSTFRALSFHVEARPVLKLEKRIYANIADEERFTFEHWARTTVIAGTWFVPGGEAKINLNIGGWYWDLGQAWPNDIYEDVVWLNEPKDWEVAVVTEISGARMYGETITEREHSHAAILIHVPSWGKRDLSPLASA